MRYNTSWLIRDLALYGAVLAGGIVGAIADQKQIWPITIANKTTSAVGPTIAAAALVIGPMTGSPTWNDIIAGFGAGALDSFLASTVAQEALQLFTSPRPRDLGFAQSAVTQAALANDVADKAAALGFAQKVVLPAVEIEES